MVKRQLPLDTDEMVCPACGAGIRATAAARRRRVQCPKCREVVFIESSAEKESDATLPVPDPSNGAAEMHRRVESLEARVKALEATLISSPTTPAAPTPPPAATAESPHRKLRWITTPPGQAPEFTNEQWGALCHNLGGVHSQPITIRTPANDYAALRQAEWFKSVFERAGWTVHGPEEIVPRAHMSGLALTVPELPVAKAAAAAYLALKAAGFEPIPVLDSEGPLRTEDGAMAISLTVPPGKAA